MIIPSAPSPTSVLASSASSLGESRFSSRGAFIVLEGVDRCGKTTQSKLLLKHLLSLGLAATAMQFPNRETSIGKVINSYLKQDNDLSHEAIHLLFSANRWEAVPSMSQDLAKGTNIICDRYAHSGVAFSSAKDGMDRTWCQQPDVGLPAPDAVIFLNVPQEVTEQRGGFGTERYEKRDFQNKVRKEFEALQKLELENLQVPWHVVDATGTISDVQEEINGIVQQTMEQVAQGKPLFKLWSNGEEMVLGHE